MYKIPSTYVFIKISTNALSLGQSVKLITSKVKLSSFMQADKQMQQHFISHSEPMPLVVS